MAEIWALVKQLLLTPSGNDSAQGTNKQNKNSTHRLKNRFLNCSVVSLLSTDPGSLIKDRL